MNSTCNGGRDSAVVLRLSVPSWIYRGAFERAGESWRPSVSTGPEDWRVQAIGIVFRCSSTARTTLAPHGRCVFSARQCW